MENKYYTPSAEEFNFGFEAEINLRVARATMFHNSKEMHDNYMSAREEMELRIKACKEKHRTP